MDWIHLAQDRDKWRTLWTRWSNLEFLWNGRDFVTGRETVRLSRNILLHKGLLCLFVCLSVSRSVKAVNIRTLAIMFNKGNVVLWASVRFCLCVFTNTYLSTASAGCQIMAMLMWPAITMGLSASDGSFMNCRWSSIHMTKDWEGGED